jgi:DNA-binding NtrC family response regulator
VPDLCRHFLHQIAKRDRSTFRHIEPEALRLLQRYDWPGNVRELQNIIERATVLETQPGVIRAATLAPWLSSRSVGHGAAGSNGGGGAVTSAVEELAGKPLADIEKRVILSTLQQFKGHRAKTAVALGIGVRTLGMKLKRWKDEGQLQESEA